MGDILSLAKKLERAMRNGTGFNVTSDEVSALIEDDIVDAVYAAKLKRLKARCPGKLANTSSEIIGSTSGATALPPISAALCSKCTKAMADAIVNGDVCL